MIRMVLFGLGFLLITAALVIFQPGLGRLADDAPAQQPAVTRATPALASEQMEAPDVVVRPAPEPRVAARATVATPPVDMDDQSLRRMTWDSLNNLNQATGQDSAPGQPGSLLHTIVRRSLNEAEPARPAARQNVAIVPQPQQGSARTYTVQSGDSLVSIAEKVYGDVNMTGPLFAANQAILARPDDLRPGQTLVLPGG